VVLNDQYQKAFQRTFEIAAQNSNTYAKLENGQRTIENFAIAELTSISKKYFDVPFILYSMQMPDAAVQKIRDGLFLASSRTYGEQYVEPFIREKYDLIEPKDNAHDATDKNGKQYEIKSCKVLRETGNTDKSKSLYERILFENTNLETSRLIPFSESNTANYGANVQNVKRDHFHTLIYVMLFEDCAKVFFIGKDEIESIPNWSDKHGRYDQLGKSGQFPITKNNIVWHIENTLKDTVTYEEMTRVFQKLSGNHDR